MNSGLERVGVLTQYKPLSADEPPRFRRAWDLTGRTRGITILPPPNRKKKDSDWYKGTADALRQNLDFLPAMTPTKFWWFPEIISTIWTISR